MSNIVCCLPIHASAKFYIDKPDDWESMSYEDKKDFFIMNMERHGGICHHCSDIIETDFEYDQEYFEDLSPNNIEFYEEESCD